jgi:hypothetical protein
VATRRQDGFGAGAAGGSLWLHFAGP